MKHTKIHLCLAHMSGQEQRFIQEAFDTNWVTPLGPSVSGFEESLEHFLGEEKHVTALISGTAAIHLALLMLGVGPGDEVICQSFTFSASANPIVYQGAAPVFVDSEPHSWNMSPQLLEEAIEDRIRVTGRKPKALVVVHLYGMPAMMDEITEIARRYEIPIVEDAAEAMGASYNGRQCGTMGDYGILSFNGNKMITTSGGGALICPSEESKLRAQFYATQAREPFPYYQHEKIGYNYRMSNICAAIGRGQMTIVDQHIAHHRSLHQLYSELLADVPGITVHQNPTSKQNSNYWLTTIQIDPDKTGTDCNAVREYLDTCGVESRPLWKPMHLQPVFAGAPTYVNGISEHLFLQGLCLPSGPCVSEEDARCIVEAMVHCIKK
ncbi:DegT/DnrJ/EryC1/StrS family aminotransferase [Bacteroides sp. AN502(2024)]|uniref:DegT/DnrJ/EryC1/StrS family aminotransferase n=1 Tax=Bacteroides sp. AN502(2024) TaxID=3160599 RepID=UPI003518AA90